MDNSIFFIVLFASFTHAIWNGMVKNHQDKAIAISGIVFGRLPLSIIAIIFLPLPTAESIPYLIISVIIHQGYQWFLLSSYEIGDLTKVYPIARGTGPLVATIISISLSSSAAPFPQAIGVYSRFKSEFPLLLHL